MREIKVKIKDGKKKQESSMGNIFNAPSFHRKFAIFKILMVWIAVFICNGSFAQESQAGKLTPPSAPFIKEADKTLKAETFKPEVKGDKIISGNKSLQIKDDGQLCLFSGDGRKPVKIDFGFKTTGDVYASIHDGKDASSSYDKASQTFTLTANYPMDKPKAGSQKYFKATQKVTLATDGIIHVIVTRDFPESDKQCFQKAYVWLCWEDSRHGEKVLSGGKECTVSNIEGKDYWWFAEAHKSGEEIEFFPNRPEESFKLIPKDFDLLLVHSKGAPEKARLSVDITRDPGKGDSISYDLDIRNAVAEQTNK